MTVQRKCCHCDKAYRHAPTDPVKPCDCGCLYFHWTNRGVRQCALCVTRERGDDTAFAFEETTDEEPIHATGGQMANRS